MSAFTIPTATVEYATNAKGKSAAADDAADSESRARRQQLGLRAWAPLIALGCLVLISTGAFEDCLDDVAALLTAVVTAVYAKELQRPAVYAPPVYAQPTATVKSYARPDDAEHDEAEFYVRKAQELSGMTLNLRALSRRAVE